jgi:hypothetical protein
MNRISILTIIFVTVFFAAASAQVDTLMLNAIGGIESDFNIDEIYAVDVGGDGDKEIFVCTEGGLGIYDGVTYMPIWGTNQLSNPTNLLFQDITRDGYLDMFVKDDFNIRLFDLYYLNEIWTGPPLDSTYSCYTIGDVDGDDSIDVAIVSKEWFTRQGNYDNFDTVWVELYKGPSFQIAEEFFLLFEYWYVDQGAPGMYWLYKNNPSKIAIGDITGDNGTSPKLIIASKTSNIGSVPGYFWNAGGGDVLLIDPDDYSSILLRDVGATLYYTFLQIGNNVYLYALTDFILDDTWGHDIDKKLLTISSDTILASEYVWRATDNNDWLGFIIDDISPSNNGSEFCYSADGSLVMQKFPGLDTLWSMVAENVDSVLYGFTDSSLLNSPQIIVSAGYPAIEYRYYDSEDGSLSAILPDPGFQLSHITDLDGDGDDEILSIQGTSLHIYNLDYATGTGDETRLPIHFFLRPNYPNPFNSSTTIEYGLPEPGRVRIDIYDLLGRRVETLVDEEMQPGRHQVTWDASGYSSGVYFYRIEAGDFVNTKRMVYLK